jgi:hypothetical protein
LFGKAGGSFDETSFDASEAVTGNFAGETSAFAITDDDTALTVFPVETRIICSWHGSKRKSGTGIVWLMPCCREVEAAELAA